VSLQQKREMDAHQQRLLAVHKVCASALSVTVLTALVRPSQEATAKADLLRKQQHAHRARSHVQEKKMSERDKKE
jgi:hypothetical protein